MALTIQTWDKITGDLTAGPIYVCRQTIQRNHTLLRAWVYVQNVVFTGVVEVRLRKADRMDGRAGSDIAKVLTNDDFEALTSVNVRYDFLLLDFVQNLAAPAERMYFLSLSGTNAADRFDEPLLVVEYA